MKKVEALGHKDCGPYEFTYQSVIKAWSKSGHPDAHREIAALEMEMNSLTAEDRRGRK
jgi:hypothetical protein